MNPPAYVCALADADRVPGCGGKAAQLARLLALSLPVPAGFVLTDAAFQAFVDHNGLRADLEALARLLMDEGEKRDTAAQDLRRRVLGGSLPPELRQALAAQQPLLNDTVIVRSSALGEDSGAASFAGQLDSILDVAANADAGGVGCEALATALRACWASYWSQRALAYQRSRGVRLGGMGVIVQHQIQPVFAGVLFTTSPERAAANGDLLVEYCRGHGEALVQGRVNPGRVAIARADLRVRRLALPETEATGPDDAMFAELARAGLAVERAFGVPQDIEWALDAAQRCWLVQARPITTADRGNRPCVLWSNANLNENYPEPVSPLLYSIARTSYYHYFRNLGLAFGLSPQRVAAMEQPLRQIVGAHGARLYYHLTNIHAVLRAAPFGERLASYFSAFTGAEPTPTASVPRDDWGARVEAARMAVTAARVFRTLPGRVADFERTVDAFAERTTHEKLAGMSGPELLEALRGFLEIRFYRWTNASLADAAAMISYGALKHLLGRAFPEAEQAALHNTLLKGLTDLVSGAPIAALWELSRMVRADAATAAAFARLDNRGVLDGRHQPELAGFRAALAGYLRRWGFRRSGELLLTVPDFEEQPGPLLDIVRAYAAVDGESPPERLERQRRERLSETRRVLNVLGSRRLRSWLPWPTMASVVRPLLRWCQAAIGLRERARMRQALLYTRCRSIVLSIGQRRTAAGDFESADDVFFLTYQEIEDLLAGATLFPHHVRDLVRLRRAAHAEMSAEPPPSVFSLPAGTYLPRHAPGAGVNPGAESQPAELTGVGACGGLASGPAAVLADVVECGRLQPGDVLVTRQTDPGWGPAFPLISGLVLERGGMLSHGAILAREYGIPTVVGVRDAAVAIRSGQIVHVDGDRGVVRLAAR